MVSIWSDEERPSCSDDSNGHPDRIEVEKMR